MALTTHTMPARMLAGMITTVGFQTLSLFLLSFYSVSALSAKQANLPTKQAILPKKQASLDRFGPKQKPNKRSSLKIRDFLFVHQQPVLKNQLHVEISLFSQTFSDFQQGLV